MKKLYLPTLGIYIGLLLAAAACQPTEKSGATMTAALRLHTVQAEATQMPAAIPYFGFTYQAADGNRLVLGKGTLPQAKPLDIQLASVPQWLVGGPIQGGSLWVVVLEDGQVQAFEVVGGKVVEVALQPARLSAGMPPMLAYDGGRPYLVTAPSETAATNTHPVIFPSSGKLAYLEDNGDLVIQEGGKDVRLEVNALPDARLLMDENERLLFLSDPTSVYDHAVVGDIYEATSITLVETQPTARVALTIPIPAGQVIEGVMPIWADLNGDGSREIIVTLSDGIQGAQIVVYDESGTQIAIGEPIGKGYRWRHQIAAAPFGPIGEIELVDVLTPHIGGVIEFFQIVDGMLASVATLGGYTSHTIHSRNLDMAAAGDFNGDGIIEVLLPIQDLTQLAGVQRSSNGVEVLWEIAIGGRQSTNLAFVRFADNQIGIGVGSKEGVLRLWLP